MKLSEALRLFLRGVKADGLSAQTEEWYRKRLQRLVRFFNDADLGTVTSDDLRRFVVSLREQSVKYENHPFHKPVQGWLSPSTQQGYVRCIKRLYNWLEENEYITVVQNVALRLKRPRIPKQAPKEVAESDLMALLRVARTWGRYPKRNHALVLFLAETGCRVAGLVNLRVSDIDLEKGQAMVTEKGSNVRIVFFGEVTKGALSAWLDDRLKDTDYLWTGERGRLTVYGVRLVLRRLKRVAGISGRVNPHAFRHSFAKRTLVRGGDLAFLSDLMGHSDIKVTRDVYLIFRTEELKRAHRRYSSLDGLLKSESLEK